MESYPLSPTSFIELQVEIRPAGPAQVGATSMAANAVVTSPDGRLENLTLVLEGLPDPNEIAASEGLAILRGASSDPAWLLRDIGRRLFRALFVGPLRRSYAQAADLAAKSGRSVALRIVTDDPALLAQPWELLVDDEQRRTSDFLALAGWSIVRDLPRSPADMEQPGLDRLRVLVLVADLPFPVERDLGVLDSVSRENPSVELTVARVSTAAEVSTALQTNGADVIHYAGVGEGSSRSARDPLARPDVAPSLQLTANDRMPAKDLGDALRVEGQSRLVVLNGAFTDRAAAVLAQTMPSVVGLSGQVLGDACLQFADGLYRAIAAGATARAAVVAGRQNTQYRFPQDRYWSSPVHYDRGEVVLLASPGASQGAVLEQPASRGAVPEQPEAAIDESTALLLEQKATAERNLELLRHKLENSTGSLPPTLLRQHDELVELVKQLDDRITGPDA